MIPSDSAKKRTALAPILAIAGLLLLAQSVQAASVSGTFSLWGYVRDDSVEHVQVVPALSFTARELGRPDLRFEGSVRCFRDIRGGELEDPTLRFLRGVLVWTPVNSRWEWRVGQQWLSEGVGYGTLAGVLAKHRFSKRTSLVAYAGARTPQKLELSRKNDNDGAAAGVNVRSKVSRFNVGASYYHAVKHGDLYYQAAGVDASGRLIPKLSARARLDMNLAQSALERGQLLLDWSARDDLVVTGEFRSQTPRVYEDSYFTLFLSEASTEFVRAGARWNFYKMFFVRGGGYTLFTDQPDPLYKVQAAVGCKRIELGYTHWMSAGKGTMDGFFGQWRYEFRDVADAFAGFDFARGSNGDTDLRPATDSQALYFGASVTPVKPLSGSVRIERIEDSWYKEDWRGLFSLSTRFSTVKGGGR